MKKTITCLAEEDIEVDDDANHKGWCIGCRQRTFKPTWTTIVAKGLCQTCLDLANTKKLSTPPSLPPRKFEPPPQEKPEQTTIATEVEPELPKPINQLNPEPIAESLPTLASPTVADEIKPEPINPLNPETEVKISEIVARIKTLEKAAWKALRAGLIEIESLGGFEPTLTAFCDRHGLLLPECSKQLTCGRIERLLEIPLNTYSKECLIPLFQFRIFVPVGFGKGGNRTNYGKMKRRESAEIKVKEAWAIAIQIAKESNLLQPDKDCIKKAVQTLADKGEAKSPKDRTTYTTWRDRCIKSEKTQSQLIDNWKDKYLELETKLKDADRERDRLQQQLEEVQKERDRLQEKLNALKKLVE